MVSIRLHRARKAAGLSRRALAELVGISSYEIKKYEYDISIPSSDILIRLARALDVRTEYFFRQETISLDGIKYCNMD
jgi:transcriptional regulator with XRE-family HTH domain